MSPPHTEEIVAPGEVVVEDLWELFRIYHSRPRGIKDRLFRFERAVYEDFWALKGVSFELKAGESLAALGPNGSGKSTLLKCLANILPVDRGRVGVGGKVASLLELGAGFHGDLSGRENVYLNGSILGVGRRQMDAAFDEIVDFAGVEDFIDTPVRNYSSGMYVRLGFAVAVNVDPDVLLIDEILSVGDAAFQTKCFEKMHDFKRRKKTIVLVTHDLDSAARLCDRAILLDRGKVVSEGKARSVVNAYRQKVMAEQSEGESHSGVPSKRWGSGEAEILDVQLIDERGELIKSVPAGASCAVRLRVGFKKDIEEPIFSYIIHHTDGTQVFNTNSMWHGISTGTFRAGEVAEVVFRQKMNVLPGRYTLTATLAHQSAKAWFDWWNECLFFDVRGEQLDQGYANLEPEMVFRTLAEREINWSP